MDGWVKLHRRIKDSIIFADPDLLRLYLLCLFKATYVRRSILVDKQEIILKPGQFVTGRKSLTQEYNEMLSSSKKVKETTLWSWVKKFENWGKFDIKSTNKYSIITIVNWAEEQGILTTEQQRYNNRWTTERQQNDTNKKEKEKNKDKKGIEGYDLFK